MYIFLLEFVAYEEFSSSNSLAIRPLLRHKHMRKKRKRKHTRMLRRHRRSLPYDAQVHAML